MVWLVARHYERTRDLEFVRAVYKRLVVQPAEFMIEFRDPLTRLPKPRSTSGRSARASSPSPAPRSARASTPRRAGEPLQRTGAADALRARGRGGARRDGAAPLAREERRFARGLLLRDDDTLEVDPTIDASAFAHVLPRCLSRGERHGRGNDARDPRETLGADGDRRRGALRERSLSPHRGGRRIPGNPWLICTLWLAEHAIARATSVAELQSALDLVRWARSKARPSLDPAGTDRSVDGSPLSVAPFTWSHAQVVSVVRGYLEALRFLRRECGNVMRDEEKIARESR